MFKAVTCFLLLSSCAILAQDFRATISGRVTDPAGSVVASATVKATKDGTNETKTTETNQDGIYTLPYLDPGSYTVEATAAGFKGSKRSGIALRVADKLEVPMRMEIGDVKEQVTVSGDQTLIETQTASRGLVFDPLKVQEYPLNGRQSYMLMMLTPGVLFTQQQFGSDGFSGTRGWDVNGAYTINGGRTGTNQFLLNGAPISTEGTWQIAPNVEAIQEFKVMTNTYDAQYGRSGGGWVNTTIKSGTNEIHGSLFDFWRNRIFDANTTQNNQEGAERGKRNQHQFGGAVGLPIRKDKDFLFFSFEGWRERVPFPVVSDTPPAITRDGGGFAAFNQRIYDPLTSRTCLPSDNCRPGALFVRQPFAGNVIPASRISPIGQNILNLYPAPNQIGAATINQNFFATGAVGRYEYNQPMVRYDKIFNESNRLSALFYFQSGSEFRNQNGFQPPVQEGNIFSTRKQFGTIVNYTRVLSPTLVFDVRASHTRFSENFPDVSDSDFTWDRLGIQNIPTVPNFVNRHAPRIELNDYESVLGNRTINFSSQDQITIAPSLSQVRGKHNLKYGAEFATIIRANRDEGRSSGQFTFGRFWTQQYSGVGQGNSDGSPIASLLLGYPTGGFIDFNDTYLRREPYAAGYIHDDWKVASNLTLNLGMRYDVQWPLIEIRNRLNTAFDFNSVNPLSDPVLARWRQLQAQYNATNPEYPYPAPPAALLGGIQFAGVNGQPSRVYDFDWTNVQPRVGLAWKFLDKTVMRGGFGVFHRTATQGSLTTGFSQQTPYLRSLDGDRTPSAQGFAGPYSLSNPFPNGIIAPSGSSLGLLTNVGRGVSYDQRYRPIPRTYQYSFSLEQQLPWNMVIEAAYVGSRTYKEPIQRPDGANQGTGLAESEIPLDVRQRGIADPDSLNNPIPNPYLGILPSNSDLGAGQTINASQLYRRVPLFPGVRNNNYPIGAVWYNGLQIRLEKRAFNSRATGAFTWVLSYTFAKQMERYLRNDFNFGNEQPISQLTDIDRPQQFSFSGVWDIPVGKTRNFKVRNGWLNAIVGDWNYNFIFTYYAGTPINKPDANFTCGEYRVQNQTRNQWFNNDSSCYSQRAPFTLREVEQRFSNIRQDTAPQLNMAIAKKFNFGDRYNLEFRGESFNTTNTPIFGPPNTAFQNPLFGVVTAQQYNFPRQIQLALRLRF